MSSWIFILGNVDERLLHAVVLRRGRVLDRVMRAATVLGGPVVTVGVGLLLLSGWTPISVVVALEVAFTLAVSHLLVQVVKRAISRPRPTLRVVMRSHVDVPDRFSFPSGHAAASLSVVLPLLLVVPLPLALGLLALALLVGVSRCYLGVHYPGDVLMGWFLAGGTALVADWAVPVLLVHVTAWRADWAILQLLTGILS